MIEVFKTDVKDAETAKAVVQKLLCHFPNSRINFDLHDCDKILRVEGECISVEKIKELISLEGYQAIALQ
jgi:hypothetical protein